MLEQFIIAADNALRTLSGVAVPSRPLPAARHISPKAEAQSASAGHEDAELSQAERSLSGALMRVNHVGEVCAQALYIAQSMATQNPELRQKLREAARDETDHLAWTQQRLDELGSRPSLLNPLWYAGSFAMGWLAGRSSESMGLGFVVETERQVEQHLDGHLDRLPAADTRSRAIVRQMKADEARHAQDAQQSGGSELPGPLRWAMRAAAVVMTRTAHHL
jgi:ubiquinone biosynthesis monooxygenase Coq7